MVGHRKLFDIVWPKRRDRIKIVEGNIEKHARLIGENITSEHIRRQEEARVKSFEEFREAEEHRAEQRFQALKTSVRPQSYNQKLDFLKRQICPGIAEWLVKDKTFLDWVNIGSQSTTRSLWLQGIPGAGKTFLASWVVTRVKGAPGRAIYAFLSHTFVDTTTISIIHSLLFQLASGDEDIQAMLLHPDKREFVSDTAVAKALLADALKCAGNTFLIVDGLDEVEELERRGFLSSVMEILDSHPGLRLCISSRAEDEQTIHENLLVGKYRFLAFASSAWMDLVKQSVRFGRRGGTLGALNELLEDKLSVLQNPKFQQPSINDSDDVSRRPLWPRAPELIVHSLRFYQDPDDIWTVDNAEMWVQRDPLIISECYTKIETVYNRLFCGKDDPRHAHMENHCRPWKCPVASCDFAMIGFLNQGGLERHKERLHKVVRADSAALNEASHLEDEALYLLLYGLVDAGDVDELEAIWPVCRSKVNDKTVAELVTMAAAQGSLSMVRLLWEWDDKTGKPRNNEVKVDALVHDALQSGDQVLSRCVLEKATHPHWRIKTPYRDTVVAVLKSDSADTFAIWKETLADHKGPAPRLGEGIEERHLGKGLVNIAQSTCSIEQARVLLKLGAPIDYPSGLHGGYTALHWACKKNSEDAAHFARFLLLEGAEPRLGYGNSLPRNEVGAKKIQHWLGMDWSELITWVKME
ncbi:hypothetical protein V8F06_014405 [Rhypophila decipiens]